MPNVIRGGRGALVLAAAALLTGCVVHGSSNPSAAVRADEARASRPEGGPSHRQTVCRRTLAGVAHPDDDLFFINPDIMETIRAGCFVTTVYLTAGDAGEEVPQELKNYVTNRENGVRKAYAEMAGAENKWTLDEVRVDGRSIRSFRLAGRGNGADVRLTFMGLHDGRPHGRAPESLLRLFSGEKKAITPDLDGQSYSEEQLLSALSSLARLGGAERILTMDPDNASFGLGMDGRADHGDHGITARYFRQVAYRTGLPLTPYLGYIMAPLKRNLAPAQEARKENIIRWYIAQARCPRESVCASRGLHKGILSVDYRRWTQRQYTRRHRAPQQGEIMGDIGRTTMFGSRLPEQCLDVKDGSWSAGLVQIAGCNGSDAQKWDAENDGTIRTRLNKNYCLTAAGRDVKVEACKGSRAEQKWQRVPWKSTTWKRAAWKIAGDGNRCLYQNDRLLPRWNTDERKSPRLALASCGGPVQPELYWQWGGR
ncbi:ricin-type beta-trefoil lectin protein [Streptomyces sp. 3211.6]|uniref:ricin-type beta-trefoil lectin domain protein n=1 Tax=Streptomyces sp. 3211.6 TaxID=1938845 RepID=UPI000EB1E318|nr:ricin-type beta-trefoil lectin domain protein [Streptomyces sp. 3211.6]RKT04113.1 ricin-type beta-trefoil lectin protein [Streptomyces sp. 3211.6]